jgi:C-terminal processing protease CtpA/Prc
MTGIEQLRVSRVCGNSPAEEAGIVAGEYVVGYGATQTQLSHEQTFDAFATFLEDYDAGEEFYVKILGIDGVERILALAKQQYVENYVFYRTSTKSYRFVGEKAVTPTEKGQPLTALDENTAYIRLAQFNGVAADEFDGAMSLFKQQGKKNLVLDLRGNGGGYLDIMLKIASYFCKDANKRKPVVAIADYGDYQEKFSAPKNLYDEYFQADSRITVLADIQTASASECLIGCMLDYKTISYGDICLAERNGVAKTFGKGIMQSTYTITGGLRGDAVKLTTARICWPVTKNCIHARGILPDDGALTTEENIDDEKELVAGIAKLFA